MEHQGKLSETLSQYAQTRNQNQLIVTQLGKVYGHISSNPVKEMACKGDAQLPWTTGGRRKGLKEPSLGLRCVMGRLPGGGLLTWLI